MLNSHIKSIIQSQYNKNKRMIFNKRQYENILVNKFERSLSPEKICKGHPIRNSLPSFLYKHTQFIKSTIQGKHATQQKLKKKVQSDIQYRQQLLRKLVEDQKKHCNKRQNIIKQKMKSQRFKLEDVERVSKHKKQMEKQQRLKRKSEFQHKQYEMQTFWERDQEVRKQKMERQTAVQKIYDRAVVRKKQLLEKEFQNADTNKLILLNRHSDIRQRKNQLFTLKNDQFEQKKQQMLQAMLRKTKMQEIKTQRAITSIVEGKNKSQKMIIKKKAELEKKIQNRVVDRHDLMIRTQGSFKSKTVEKFRSLNECKCKTRQESLLKTSQGLSGSVFFNGKESPKDQSIRISNPELNFIHFSQEYPSLRKQLSLKVKSNLEQIKKQREQIAQKTLQKSKQISQTLKLRNQIRNEGNILLRKAKSNQFDPQSFKVVTQSSEQDNNQIQKIN